jgi:hypothetical protein
MSQAIDSRTPIQKAASAILTLINNRPASPRADEIEVIIEYALAKPAGFAPTISAIAADLPALYDLREAMGGGETFQDQREDGLHGVPADERPKRYAFEILKDQAHARVQALEALMFLLEPQSADEALSMLLLGDSAFEAFAAEAYGTQELPEAEEALWRNITRMHHALVRWLHRSGAGSPLLKEHFHESYLEAPSEQTAEALIAAKELKAQFRSSIRANSNVAEEASS